MNIRALYVGIAGLGLGLLLGVAPVERGGDTMGSAEEAYMQANETMSRAMARPMVGDADIDFATMMIAHHQGAIDMANVELQYGKDPELRDMAQKIVDAQTKEIAVLREWLGGREPAR